MYEESSGLLKNIRVICRAPALYFRLYSVLDLRLYYLFFPAPDSNPVSLSSPAVSVPGLPEHAAEAESISEPVRLHAAAVECVGRPELPAGAELNVAALSASDFSPVPLHAGPAGQVPLFFDPPAAGYAV